MLLQPHRLLMEGLDSLPSKVQKVSVPLPVGTGMNSNTSPAASFDSVETTAVIGRRGSSLQSPSSILLMFFSPPVAGGVSTAAVAAASGQPTEFVAGADAPAPSAEAITAGAVTSANPVE
jgi:hypothetical protein